jgi:hypothetical protein
VAYARFLAGDAPANGGDWPINWTVWRRWHSASLHGTHPILLDTKIIPQRTAAQAYLVRFVNSEHGDVWVYRTWVAAFGKKAVAMYEAARQVGLSQHESIVYQVYQQLHPAASVAQQRYTERRAQLVSQLQLQLQTAWHLLSQTTSQSRVSRQLAAYLHSPTPQDLAAQLHIARQLDLLVQPDSPMLTGPAVTQLRQHALARQQGELEQLLQDVMQGEAARHQARVQQMLRCLESIGVGEEQQEEPDVSDCPPKRQCQ